MASGFTLDWYNGWSPEQRLATLPVQRDAIGSGALQRPARCSICSFDPKEHPGTSNCVWLHDEDYADPLAAYAVCRRCHRALHERFEDPLLWLALVERHGTGGQWFELLTMDPASKHRPFTQTYPNGLPLP